MGKSRLSRTRNVYRAGTLAVLAAGCGGGASFPTATETTKAARQPDGVALEPPPALPSAADRAEARGVIGLREPVASSEVEEVVRSYLRAFEREDSSALAALLTTDAAGLDRGYGSASARQQMIDRWSAKMRSFDYKRIAGQELARYAELERYSFDTFGGAGSPARPNAMRTGDLYVRVPMSALRGTSEPLFGEVLVLLLRREDGRLKIAGQADE